MLQTTLVELAQRMVAKLRESSGKPVVLEPYFVAAVSNVIFQLTFGEVLDHDDPELMWFKHKFEEAFENFFHPM